MPSAFGVGCWALSVGRFLVSYRVTVFLGCGFAAKYREGGGLCSATQIWGCLTILLLVFAERLYDEWFFHFRRARPRFVLPLRI
jgi:hypothetical protein